MTSYRAVTKSGTIYEGDGRLKITSPRDGVTVFTPYVQVAVSREELESVHSWQEFRELLATLPHVEVPVVGKHFYVAGRDDWRLSTPITEVKILDA